MSERKNRKTTTARNSTQREIRGQSWTLVSILYFSKNEIRRKSVDSRILTLAPGERCSVDSFDNCSIVNQNLLTSLLQKWFSQFTRLFSLYILQLLYCSRDQQRPAAQSKNRINFGYEFIGFSTYWWCFAIFIQIYLMTFINSTGKINLLTGPHSSLLKSAILRQETLQMKRKLVTWKK